MNLKFVLRSLLLGIPLALAIVLVWFVLNSPLAQPLDPAPPPPPAIDAPAGPLPRTQVALKEWARYAGQEERAVGCGFFFRLPAGQVVAATPAHAVALGNAGAPLQQIVLGVAGQPARRWTLDQAMGPPGQGISHQDLSADHLLLAADPAVDPALVLTPDPRGGPQPGERVVLYSGLGDGRGGPRTFEGTVQSATERAIWVVMDRWFNPMLMSGSPILSQHTGQAVGMLTVGSVGGFRLLLGAVPIGALVAEAGAATTPVPLPDLGAGGP
jgi:hypothetical protein